MSKLRRVAVITGASRGIGDALVTAYRTRDYRVVAVARSITASSDPDILTVTGETLHVDGAQSAGH